MTDEPTMAEPPPSETPPPDRRRPGFTLAVVASLAFLLASGALLGWVLGSSETTPDDAEPQATTKLDRARTTRPARATTEPEAEAEPVSRTTLLQVGPLAPASVSASNTRALTPKLACTGGSISYFADQLTDGTDLGWGASSSDGTGQYFDVSFDKPVHLSTVGITPGYLREARRPSNDCEPASSFGVNRFVNAVEWTFDDGTSVIQRFEQRPEMQFMSVDAVTSSVRMTILETTRPPGADDDTVISEASFTGAQPNTA
ncbi:MAG: hypothetical protein IPF42_14880 [Candidatus Microthrix sp.]|nr:hypothetical protein [Candidatus Microthrix sp.]